MGPARTILLTVALSVAAAVAGAWGGAHYLAQRSRPPAPLHQLLHQLRLTPAQDQRIATLERDFAARRAGLEAEMRAANADLARELARDHAYTPGVQQAVERFHAAMAALQKETILHVLAMRSVLTPDQTGAFDRAVAKALTQAPS